MTPRIVLLTAVCAVVPAGAVAQGYRARIDVRAQAVSYRGVSADSIPASQALTDPGGSLTSPDGFALNCVGATCFFFRPGPVRRGVPVSTTGSIVAWGVGMPGLSVHASARRVGDLGNANAWPGTEPNTQLLDGYVELDRGSVTARAGRLMVFSRLEPIGMDGAWTRARWREFHLDFTAYGGWGLGQAAVVPVASPVLNPLDEWRPRDRQLVAGAEVAWLVEPVDLRMEYRREVDPETDYFVSERAALSANARLSPSIRVTGGADYNLAEGHLGSADLGITWMRSRLSVTAGGRRYRPYFSLWTLWGAFSPVPYHAVHAGANLKVNGWLTLRSRAERYRYANSEASTPLVNVEEGGWRASTGLTVSPDARLVVDAGWLAEFGPGASSRSIDGSVSYQPLERLSFGVYGGTLDRPLELRFSDAQATWIGGRTEWRSRSRWRVWADGAWFDEQRNRPDAGASMLDQFRLRSGVTIDFGTNADRAPLPPARRGRS